jgi:DNA-binding transcriptional LysR family regulator
MMLIIMPVNLSSIDLNLFLVLYAVLEERSATRAAARLNVTQSAVSNALSRLRRLLGDPLVVRNGRGLAPTPRAEELEPLLREATERLSLAIGRRGLSPRKRHAPSRLRCQTIIKLAMCHALLAPSRHVCRGRH